VSQKGKTTMAQEQPLSQREEQVVRLLLQGKSNKLIALALGISDRTVEFHLKNIYTKLQVRSRVELILKLGKTPGYVQAGELGSSTVDRAGEKVENRGRSNAPTGWAASFKDTVSIIAKELIMRILIKSPSAFLPLAMSLAALAVVLTHVALFGAARQADEGAAAHIWQILMAGQLPIMAFFVVKWLPRTPIHTLAVLALQGAAALAALAPVFLLKL
jgi:DNA-binding CsgD family transcriptional regulator